ncbi:MAG: enoyl-CoA hydratase/isomerase family protein [Pseudoxanthomonas sp.]
MAGVLLVDRPAEGVLRLRINRPDKRNAIDHDVRQALTEALLAARDDASVRALVFGGSGGVFSAGGDLPSMAGLSEEQARERMRHIHVLCRLVADAGVPVISAVEGFGAGGAVGLALLGDLIVVGRGSRLLFPFLKLGLAPDWGLLRTLPARVGLSTARRLLTDGQIVDGEEAARIGLADEFVGDSDVMQVAIERAGVLSRLPLTAFSRMKERLNEPASTLDGELQREEDDQAELLRSADFQEGYAAFGERREAHFTSPLGRRS